MKFQRYNIDIAEIQYNVSGERVYGMEEILRRLAKELYDKKLITENEYKAVLREIDKQRKENN